MNQNQDVVDVLLEALVVDKSTELAHRNKTLAAVFVIRHPDKVQDLLDCDVQVVALGERLNGIVHGWDDLNAALAHQRVPGRLKKAHDVTKDHRTLALDVDDFSLCTF